MSGLIISVLFYYSKFCAVNPVNLFSHNIDFMFPFFSKYFCPVVCKNFFFHGIVKFTGSIVLKFDLNVCLGNSACQEKVWFLNSNRKFMQLTIFFAINLCVRL